MRFGLVQWLLIGGIVMSAGLVSMYAVRYWGATNHVVEETMVAMRDGVQLRTIVWRPAGPGRYPTVLTRGYNPTGSAFADGFVNAGYAYAGQSTRGHGGSEGDQGVANRFFDDAQDGYDTLTWISQQPWCDGNIAMYGKSYWGATQWLVAPLQHPNLKAMVPQNINPDLWERAYWDHGALQLAHTARRIYDAGGRDKIEQFGWLKWYRHLPLISLDTVAGTDANRLWRNYVSHSTYDAFWRAIGTRDKYQQIRIPVYLMAGWYDNYAAAAFTSLQRLAEVGETKEIRLVINPSDHLNRVADGRDFGRDAAKDEIALATRWLDYILKGIDNGLKEEPPIKIFVMGLNQWRYEREWPLARTRFTTYYLRSEGGSRIGRLSTIPPDREEPTTYTYDPNDPVPTLGGNHSFIDDRLAEIIRAGPVDQRSNEARADVLVFSTPLLENDLEVTGPITMKLFAASTAPDTDFIAKLIDVYPDGTAYNLTEGIIRARFRKSIWDPPELLAPGMVYEYSLELQPTSNVFLAGHQIRVHLTSSNFPLWDRNPNTGHSQGMDTELQVAHQTIYHDRIYPSHIILPVIPSA